MFLSCFLQILLTKTLLTEVLLEVTTEEIYQVAREVHRKATKGKRPPAVHVSLARRPDM